MMKKAGVPVIPGSDGSVKKIEEAFEEFPVEEEWHKGKIENVLEEENKQYKMIKYNFTFAYGYCLYYTEK